MKGLFVTGTDTNIGKTFIACTIAKVLREHGVDVGVMKPFATSHQRHSSAFASEDAWRLSLAAKVADPDGLINPYFYRVGTAPFLAATMSGRPVPNLNLAAEKLRMLSRRHEFLVVEGIGGVMVPISKKKTILDFAEMIGFPVVIVTSPKLGTINHTLLTFYACQSRKIWVHALIINKYPKRISEVQSRLSQFFSAITGVKKVIEIPRIQDGDSSKVVEELVACTLLNLK